MSHPRLKIVNEPPAAARAPAHAEPPTLPSIYEAELDDVTYRSLVRDLAVLTEIREVKVKSGSGDYASEQGCELTAALQLFDARGVAAVQVVYHYDDVLWCDTLLRTPAGVRLMRMEGWGG